MKFEKIQFIPHVSPYLYKLTVSEKEKVGYTANEKSLAGGQGQY